MELEYKDSSSEALNAIFNNNEKLATAAAKNLHTIEMNFAEELAARRLQGIKDEKSARSKLQDEEWKRIEKQLDENEEREKTIAEIQLQALLEAGKIKKEDYEKQLKLQKENIKKQRKEDEKYFNEELKRRIKEQAKADAKQAVSSNITTGSFGVFYTSSGKQNAINELTSKGYNQKEAEELFKKQIQDARGNALYNSALNFTTQLKNTIDDIGNAKSAIDTRLQGSKNARSLFGLGSYWDRLTEDINTKVALSPFITQSAVTNNIKALVGSGIAFNVEQRAFLETIKDKIATTFSATDGTLLRLIRIQQQDSTAARLGMESALTTFLNNMYETSEYMQQVADSVRSSLEEAEALMGTKAAAAFEYQVQKWLGSMYSVGMNDSSVRGIATILGQVAAGDISGINGQGAGNLVIMAANRAGMSIADILNNGLTDDETNILMNAMVDYLADIYNETKNSRVVAQQYANVFGVTASDLKAAASLMSSTKAINSNKLGYSDMERRLEDMANSMWLRTGQGEMLGNIFDNLKYTIASSYAQNPLLYGLFNIATMLKDTTGGIAIPSFSVLGTGFDLETTVADLLLVGSLGGSLLGSIGRLAAGLQSAGGFSGSAMLNAFGVLGNNANNTVIRGTGYGALSQSGMTVTDSGYIGNTSGSDVQEKAIGDAEASAEQRVAAKEEADNSVKLKDVNENVVAIFNLLQDVVDGRSHLSVTMDENSPWIRSLTGNI